ncbi:MAG: hypothetical protein LBK26_04490 [Rickettsiales bacterium]|nr:hypothetical protein [Rickettsiales bacterium]
MKNTEKSLIRTFGRIHGKRLSARQQWLVDNILPCVIPSGQRPTRDPVGPGNENIPDNKHLDYQKNNHVPDNFAAQNFRDDTAILEIGFGAGEHLLHLAETFPNLDITGAEPFMNGVASLLSRMTNDKGEVKQEYKNIRIWPDDIHKLLHATGGPQPYIRIYILHPDPWPKARHVKRRLLSAEFLNELAARLTPGGEIIIGTDHTDYFEWILSQTAASKLRIANDDFLVPPESGLDTRYMKKNKFGSERPAYLVLRHAQQPL